VIPDANQDDDEPTGDVGCSQEIVAPINLEVPGRDVLATTKESKNGLAARLSKLRSETSNLLDSLGSLRHVVPKALGWLNTSAVALLQSAVRLQPSVLALKNASEELPLSKQLRSEICFTDLTAVPSSGQTTSIPVKTNGTSTYMLPVPTKQRRDAAFEKTISKSSSSPLVGIPSRSLRRRPESRGSLQQPSAMLLDLGVEGEEAQPTSPFGLTPATLSKSFLEAKPLRSSKWSTSSQLSSPHLQASSLKLPSLGARSSKADLAGAQWQRPALTCTGRQATSDLQLVEMKPKSAKVASKPLLPDIRPMRLSSSILTSLS
jgi:hypothetical protein